MPSVPHSPFPVPPLLTGVLPIDKPVGPTSHDVVAVVRRALRTRQVGHTGTLDPFASGLLLVCVGQATRLSEYLTGLPKAYAATLRLGEATDTDDLTGQAIGGTMAWRDLSAEEIAAAFHRQVGTVQQLPPIYSAKKVDGERSYAVARRGGEVERTPVTVTIDEIRVTRVELPDVDFEVVCGSGTYIRAIARDVGDALGVGGHLRALRRTRVGVHGIGRAVPLDALDDEERIRAALLSPLDALAALPRVAVDDAGIVALGFGRAIPAPDGTPAGVPLALSGPDGRLLAIGERSDDVVKPRKVFPAEVGG